MGGMAEIVLARVKEVSPERLVVLKRMHRQLAADREFVQMFMDEARLATTLHHPNVVEVFEFGEDGPDQYYIAMEYLHGHDLRRVLSEMAARNMSIRLSHALAIITGVCRGLDYTHHRTNDAGDLLGIVHRDVSPHNVILTYNGRVKLVDFGIAKAANHVSKTRTGILKGKVAYMSPEQAMGEHLDLRSDIFCIGILLWEMTTGQWLYRRKSELETLKAVVESDAPMPSQVHPGYPRELEQIVMKTLARKPEDRWQTAGHLADALGEFIAKRKINVSPATLGTMMSSVFTDEVAAWQDARRAGATLGDHMVAEAQRENREANPRHSTSNGSGSVAGPGLSAAEALIHDPPSHISGEWSMIRRHDDFEFDSPTADHTLDGWEHTSTNELESMPTTVLHAVRKDAPEQHEETQAGSPRAQAQRAKSQTVQPSMARTRPSRQTPVPTAPAAAPPVMTPRAESSSSLARSPFATSMWNQLTSWPPSQRAIWFALGAMLVVIAAVWLVATIFRA